jgi:hypothetical protein
MSFTTAEVNGWFQTIDGLPPTTAPIPSATSNLYVSELNAGTATPLQIQANLENFPFNVNPPPTNVITATFYRTTVADFVIREFQAAWGVVPDSTQYEAWVARVIANPSLEHGGMSQALAGTPQFMAEYNTTSPTQPATVGFINQLAHNLGITPGSGAYNNVGHPVWQVLQNFVSSQVAINDMAAATANFQNLLLAGQTPSGNIFLLPSGTAQSLTLTAGVDTPTTGFTSGHGATATAAGSVFEAGPGSNPPLGVTNTLNTGDDLETSGAAIGATSLDFTAVANIGSLLANPPFAFGVTMNGVNVLNITNEAVVPILGTALTAGFQGDISGLLVVNNNSSIAPTQLGGVGQGLKTLLTNYNITGYAGPGEAAADTPAFSAIFAAAAADLTKTINIGITGGLGSTADDAAAKFVFSNDSGVAGTAAAPNNTYGTWSITHDSSAYLDLNQDVVDGGVGGATALVLSGTNAAATIAVGTGGAVFGEGSGAWQLLKSIDASGDAGTVIITGATTFNGSAYATAANPDWAFGADAGLLDMTGGGTFGLTSFKLGTGKNIIDVSSATPAQVAALTTTPNGTPNPGNTIIVNDAVATTTSATTFANIAGFDILGIGGAFLASGAGGTINMANLPGSINEIDYVTGASAAVTITNGVSALTVNVFDNADSKALTATSANTTSTTNSFTLQLGNPNDGNPAHVANVTLTGYGDVAVWSNGANGNHVGFMSLTPNFAGSESVAINGTFDIVIGAGSTQGAIADVSGGVLNVNNMTLTVNNTGTTELTDATTGVLHFVPTGNGPGAPHFDFSTNAAVINASTSGGLIMDAGDANWTIGPGSQGDVITGSATAANDLAGSLGNDTITSLGGGTVATNGGADTITIAGSGDNVDVYGVTSGGFPGGNYHGQSESITIANGADEVAQVGWWGIPTNGTHTDIHAGLAVSSDLSVVGGFNSSDTADFSVQAWDANGTNALNFNSVLGLVRGNMTAAPTNTDAVVQGGVTDGTTLNADTTVIQLASPLNNIQAVENFFASTGINLHNGLVHGNSADMLVEWQDLGGNTHIADLWLHNFHAAGSQANTANLSVSVSDMVELTGVSISANPHIHLVA